MRPEVAYWTVCAVLTLCLATGCDLFESESPAITRTTFGSDVERDRAMGAVLLSGGEILSYGETEGSHPPYDSQNAFPFLLWSGVDGGILDTVVFRDIHFGEVIDAVVTAEGVVALIRKQRRIGGSDEEIIVRRVAVDGSTEDVCRFPGKLFARAVTNSAGEAYFLIREESGTWFLSNDVCERTVTVNGEVADVVMLSNGELVLLAAGRLVSVDPSGGQPQPLTQALESLSMLLTQVGGEFVVAGLSGTQILVNRFSRDGSLIWNTVVSEGHHLGPTALAPAADEGVVLSYPVGSSDARIVAVSAKGDVTRNRRFGRNGTLREVRGLISLPGGRIAAVGWEGSPFETGSATADFDVLIEIHEWP